MRRRQVRSIGCRRRRSGNTPAERGQLSGKVGEYAPEALSEYVWWKGNAQGRTHGVGQLRPNSWGLFDMRGNVTEWVADWRSAEYYANPPPEDPTGPASGTDRVARGRDIRGETGRRLALAVARSLPSGPLWSNFGFRVAISVSR